MRRPYLSLLCPIIFLLFPLLGIWLSGNAVLPLLEFPPRPKRAIPAETSWTVFLTCVVLLIASCLPFLLRLLTFRQDSYPTSTKRPYPIWGWMAIVFLLGFWILAWNRFEWFESFQLHTFTPLWLCYITSISAMTQKRVGHCLLLSRPKPFLYLFPLSAGFWWVFEYLNRFVKNWSYHPLSEFDTLSYFLIGSICFSTVLPAVYATYELLMTCPRITAPFTTWAKVQIRHRYRAGWSLLILAGIGFVIIGIWPEFLYPFVWIAPLLMLVGIQILQDRDNVLAGLGEGNWCPIIAPALAGLVCGFFWELWNSQSLAHWEYTIPYLQAIPIFEMPLLGYAGYFPFGIECVVFIHLALREPITRLR